MTQFSSPRETWNSRYAAADGFLFGESPNAWLASMASLLKPGMRVLCVADGEGRNGVFAAQQGCSVVSFDIASVGVDKARSLASQRGVELEMHLCDAAGWDWQPQAFDAVITIFIQFAAPPLREKIFAGVGRTLKPGGLLILEGYGPRQLVHRTGGPGIAENLYTMPMLLQCFDGWQILASRDADQMVHEGQGHEGISHLVSLVARKPADLVEQDAAGAS
jgi:SAM-dependent methyltransferase